MTDQKTLTFMEAIEEALKGAIIAPITGGKMYFHKECNSLIFSNSLKNVPINAQLLYCRYYIVVPAENPKVKLHLYAIKHPDGKWVVLNDLFFKSHDEALRYAGDRTNPAHIKRLDWSEMEVDE